MIRFLQFTAVACLIGLITSGCPKSGKQTDPQGNGIASNSPAEGMVELQTQLPKPQFTGTPKNIKVPPGLKLTREKRGKFYVPKGVTNIAKGKSVTSSDDAPIVGELSQITDGDKEAGDGHFVELAPGEQWVQIDLGKTSEIFAILFWHYHQSACVYNDVVVQISDDPDFFDEAQTTTVFNNDHDNSIAKGKGKDPAYVETADGWLVDAKGTKGRYVRLYSNKSSMGDLNHYIEVEVFGK